MARNEFAGRCYVCGLTVEPKTGHFEIARGKTLLEIDGKWRVKHAVYPGFGRVTCDEYKKQNERNIIERNKKSFSNI